MKILETEVGTLEFNYGWTKLISLDVDSQSFEINLVFEAFDGELVSDQQLNNYKLFKQEQSKYEGSVLRLINEYILKESIQDKKFTPTSLVFKRDGSFGLLCDCNWDIDQGVVVILSPNEMVKNQDYFL